MEKFERALVLDCDGVIVDSEPLSCGAWNIIFEREFGIDIGTNYEGILGGNSKNAVLYYSNSHNLNISESEIVRLSILKEKIYLDTAKNKLKPVKGIFDVIKQAQSMRWGIAVASSGTLSKIEFNLQQVGLNEGFHYISGSTKDVRGKPFPDIYLQAAKGLSIDPKLCIVIEDTPSGIKAAKKAGMYVIALATTFTSDRLGQADIIVNCLDQIELENIKI